MNIPGALILIFIALSIFYYISQKTRIRREEKRERLKEAREEFLANLLRSKKEAETNNDETSNNARRSTGEAAND